MAMMVMSFLATLNVVGVFAQKVENGHVAALGEDILPITGCPLTHVEARTSSVMMMALFIIVMH